MSIGDDQSQEVDLRYDSAADGLLDCGESVGSGNGGSGADSFCSLDGGGLGVNVARAKLTRWLLVISSMFWTISELILGVC